LFLKSFQLPELFDEFWEAPLPRPPVASPLALCVDWLPTPVAGRPVIPPFSALEGGLDGDFADPPLSPHPRIIIAPTRVIQNRLIAFNLPEFVRWLGTNGAKSKSCMDCADRRT